MMHDLHILKEYIHNNSLFLCVFLYINTRPPVAPPLMSAKEQFLPSSNPSHEHLTLNVEHTALLYIIYSSHIAYLFSFLFFRYQTCTHTIAYIILCFCYFAHCLFVYHICILFFYYLCLVLLLSFCCTVELLSL